MNEQKNVYVTGEGVWYFFADAVHLVTDPNAAMIARDDTDDARHYAKKLAFIHKCRAMAAERAAKQSTALPANPALQRMSDTGSHQFGSMKR